MEAGESRWLAWTRTRADCCSRQAIKKYVQANNKINALSPAVFDSQFNRSLKAGVEAGEFTQPKGPSGPVKVAKKSTPATAAPKVRARRQRRGRC